MASQPKQRERGKSFGNGNKNLFLSLTLLFYYFFSSLVSTPFKLCAQLALLSHSPGWKRVLFLLCHYANIKVYNE
jgi:hypothetical protein